MYSYCITQPQDNNAITLVTSLILIDQQAKQIEMQLNYSII